MKNWLKILVVAVSITVSGCAVYEGGKVPKTTLAVYDNSNAPKPTLSYSSLAMGGLTETLKLSETNQAIIEGELLSVLENSAYFARISRQDSIITDKASDISLEVTLTNTGSPAALIPAVITGISLYTIPSWATDEYHLVAKVKRTDGLEKEYIMDDSTTLVQWLPMIFVFPVKGFSVVPEVRKNMYNKMLSDMQEDGFFSN